jgi:hypothetical protein
MSERLLQIQKRLAELNFDPGPLNGEMSEKTRAAVIAFQASKGLEQDGIPGPVTQSHLFPVPVDPALGRDIDQPIWPRQPDVEAFYGKPGEHLVRLQLPFPMKLDWEEATIINSFQIHAKVHDSALRCFHRIADAYDAAQRKEIGLDLFGGCFNIRPMRGGTRPSMHSWGIAIDFNPGRNELKWNHTKARLAQPDCETFWRIWEGEGWVSLGRSRDFDWMHVQAARL